MTNKDTLAVCPFCGGETPSVVIRDVEPQGDPWYGQKKEQFVECGNCGCCLFDRNFHEGFYDKNDAIAAWNTRAAPEWLPIESAPKDETWFLVINREGHMWTRSHWMPLPTPPQPETEKEKV